MVESTAVDGMLLVETSGSRKSSCGQLSKWMCYCLRVTISSNLHWLTNERSNFHLPPILVIQVYFLHCHLDYLRPILKTQKLSRLQSAKYPLNLCIQVTPCQRCLPWYNGKGIEQSDFAKLMVNERNEWSCSPRLAGDVCLYCRLWLHFTNADGGTLGITVSIWSNLERWRDVGWMDKLQINVIHAECEWCCWRIHLPWCHLHITIIYDTSLLSGLSASSMILWSTWNKSSWNSISYKIPHTYLIVTSSTFWNLLFNFTVANHTQQYAVLAASHWPVNKPYHQILFQFLQQGCRSITIH